MKTAPPSPTADVRTIETLNALLKGEIAATETYTQAIARRDDHRTSLLQDNLDSHARRALALRSRIDALGGKAAEGSGAWGAFARLIEGSATLLGREAAIATLEEGEDRGLRDYRLALDLVDGPTRVWLEKDLLPAQIRTHAAMSDARNSGKGPTPGAPGGSGMMPTLLAAVVISFAALIGSGCQEERKVGINEVTPEARTTIHRLAGNGHVVAIEEITSNGRDVAYRVEIARDGKSEHYTINGYGLIQD